MSQDDHATPTNDAEARMRLWEIIKDVRFAMFTSRHANGHLHSRPMTTQNTKVDEDATLWFFMARGGEPVADIASDPAVNIVYADPESDRYVSISGTAQVVEDAARKQVLWTPSAADWFPGGAVDPELALVQVQIIHATYWANDTSRVTQLLCNAIAAVTGKPAPSTRSRIDTHVTP